MKSLRYSQRLSIANGIRAGKSNAQIAREIGVHRATVGREIMRNAQSREAYAAEHADELSWQRKQDAVPRHRPVQMGGVAWRDQLEQHHRFYCYFSKNHYSDTHTPDYYYPTSWDPAYVRRFEKLRLTADSSFKRLRLRFKLLNTLEPMGKEAFQLENPLKEALEALQEGLDNKWQTIMLENIPETESLSVLRTPEKNLKKMVKHGVRNSRKSTKFAHLSAANYRLITGRPGKRRFSSVKKKRPGYVMTGTSSP